MYSRIEDKFWIDPMVRKMTEDARILFLYILTTPQRNIVGLFHLPSAFACYHLQWTPQRFEKALKELIKANRVKYDFDLELIFIKNFFKYQAPENPNQVKSAIEVLNELPDTLLLADLANILERSKDDKFVTLAEGLRNRFETVTKGLAKGSETVSKPVTVTVTVTDNNNSNSNTSSMSNLGRFDGNDDVDNFSGGEVQGERKRLTSKQIDEVFDLYNEITHGRLPHALKNENRRRKISALLIKHGIENLKTVFQKARESDFLCLTTEGNWGRCNFSWLLDEEKFLRILEGAYDNKPRIKTDHPFHNQKPNTGNFYDQRQRMMLESIRKEEEKERQEEENEKVRNEKNTVYDINHQPAGDPSE